MDREKAIQILTRCEAESYCSHYKQHHCCIGCGQREALDLAIEALEQTESEDYVSREVVLSLIRYWGEVYTNDKIMKMIKSLLPVTPKEQRGEWVRCEDRLPDEIDPYLVSGKMKYDTDKEYEYFVDIADYTKVEHCDYMGKFGGFFQTYNDWYEGQQEYEILAWRPLPEQYKENEDI